MKILVTGGGSIEPIDNVRAVCNFSTGTTSSFLADAFVKNGHEVTEIVSEKGVKPQLASFVTYRTFKDLEEILKKECESKKYDAVIHAAAVSDYSPYCVIVDGKEFSVGQFSKLPAGAELTVKMKKNPKLVDSLKTWCGINTKVVAFKLTSNATVEERKIAVEKILSSNEDKNLVPDFVVSNDLSEITEEEHPCTVYSKEMQVAGTVKNLQQLSDTILELI